MGLLIPDHRVFELADPQLRPLFIAIILRGLFIKVNAKSEGCTKKQRSKKSAVLFPLYSLAAKFLNSLRNSKLPIITFVRSFKT